MLSALTAAIVTLVARPVPRVQRALSVLGSIAYGLGVAALYRAVLLDPDGVLVYQVSNWDAPFGITLVADALSAFMLALAAVVSLAAVVYSVWYVDEHGQRLSYHALFHFMMVGVTGSFLTGDVFNLFVWFEVMLISSYVLVVFYSGPEQTRAALQYALLNLLGGALMLVAVGGLYATTGTLNMADMARRLANPAQFGIDPAPVLGIATVLLAVFALKAGLVPFHWWVPAAYRATPAPATAVLAGVVKKVGVYAIIRLYFTVFAPPQIPVALPGIRGTTSFGFVGPVLFVMAVASIVLGGVGAIERDDLDGLLAYSSIGQVGFIVLPLAVAATVPGRELRALGVAAALVYAVNHGIAKGTLFLASGAVRAGVGSVRFEDLGGLTERDPVLAGAFLTGALVLVGIPPLSGFFGKFLVFDVAGRAAVLSIGNAGPAPAGGAGPASSLATALGTVGPVLAIAAALGGAVLTIAYVTRAWNRGFWGRPVSYTRQPVLVAVTATLALALLVLGVAFDPFVEAADLAARAALDRAGYVDAVDPEVFEG